jgi:hypothetical protein
MTQAINFRAINSIDMVDFEEVKPQPQTISEWQDELQQRDLIEVAGLYKIKGGYSPLYLRFSTDSSIKSPRISFLSDETQGDEHFINVCNEYEIGSTQSGSDSVIRGWDFNCNKDSEEFAGFLVGFEHAYRRSLNGRSNTIN